jgi:glutamate dehydrogenase/leucine dehydrogenase
MLELLKKFEDKKPEIIFEWNDPESEATGWVVINSLRGGAAGGGTRMRKGLDRREVESLAKTMEVKFTVAGPPIGGAKSGINFDPTDPRKHEVLKRWFRDVLPLLKNYYGTGGDLFVDEIHEVIPFTSELGLLHPQEGVVNGHFKSIGKDREERIEKLQKGVSLIVDDKKYVPVAGKYCIADMITGYGVAQSVIHFYAKQGESIKEKRVAVQGWGNVGAAAGYYLAMAGAKIHAIIDKDGGLTSEDGLTMEETIQLFHSRTNIMFEGFTLDPEINTNFWKQGAEIFIPAASSRLVKGDQLETLVKNGLEVVACGANVPFADPEIFFGKIGKYADENVTLIPDFISNCGMARVFAYLMSNPKDASAHSIFNDVSTTILNAIEHVHAVNSTKRNVTATAYEIALKQLI